jgi:hypothetical protein
VVRLFCKLLSPLTSGCRGGGGGWGGEGVCVCVGGGGMSIRDLTILGRQRDDEGQNKFLQMNGSKDKSSYIINRMNLTQS